MRIVLVSTYDLGHQPFGLSSPAAWLRNGGHEVTCLDLSRDSAPQRLPEAALYAFHLPMHTATRLALPLIRRVRSECPDAPVACYGLYAPLNENLLRQLGVGFVLGGEFESGLCRVADALAAGPDAPRLPAVSLERQQFQVPDRAGLPALDRYARLEILGQSRVAGYTEASRGCKHLCKHCPVVPVYRGAFRVVQREVVIEDIRAQVRAGAQHITFGDPDFFNGPGHAAAIVEAVAQEFPGITYDVTVKVEHLLRHRNLLPLLRRTGCAFVVSAVESLENHVLAILAKGHTREDFIEAVSLMRGEGLPLSPTFIPFHPWTTTESYQEMIALLDRLELQENVAPVQLGIRLLLPEGSLLLDHPDVRSVVSGFDGEALSYGWRHPDAAVEQLGKDVQRLVARAGAASRREVFERVAARAGVQLEARPALLARAAVPYLNEPWYC